MGENVGGSDLAIEGVVANQLGNRWWGPAGRQIGTMVAAQALFLCGISVDLTLTGIVGYRLAPVHALATLPFALITLGAATSAAPASLLMARVGHRFGFLFGSMVAAVGGSLSVIAITRHNFVLFCIGTACIGIYQACAGYYRYAAADQVAPSQRGRAISTVLTGGVLAAVAGPFLATAMQGVLPTRYAGSYLFVTILAIASCALLLGFRDQTQQGALSEKTSMGHSMVDDLPPRRLRAVAFQPTFLVGTAGSMIGYLTMMILMTIAPIAALQDHHTISQAAVAVQWHMVGMYAPALFTGLIIRSIGAAQTLLLGTMSTAAGAVIAVSGISQADFMAALALVGIGWCLMYIAGSTLIAHSYRHAERTRAQGLGEALTMAGAAAGGLSAAALFEALGWHNINLLMLVPLGVCAFITGAYLVNRAWRLVHKPLEEMASRQD